MQESSSDKQDLMTGIFVGMSDGLIVPLVLCTGLSAAGAAQPVTVGAGLAATALYGLVMGIGAYAAARAGHADHQHAAEVREERILSQIGLSEETQKLIAAEHARDLEKQKEEISLLPVHAGRSARSIALSYIAGGLIPVFPYLLTKSSDQGLIWSVVITAIALLAFGFFKALYSGRNTWLGALRALLTGLLAAGSAWGVVRLFVE